MKILESAPGRYDRGIRIFTLGKLDKIYDHLASRIKKGQKVLDLGCGTGALTLRAVEIGAKVKGIDVNSQMLEIAKKQAARADIAQNIELCEMGVAELGGEKSESYDIVMAGLCFSELSEDEIVFALGEIKRILKPDGLLLIGDEVKPGNILKMIFNWLIRFPLIIITYMVVQTTTRAVKNLPEKIEEAGLLIKSVKLNKMENFIEIIAVKTTKGTE